MLRLTALPIVLATPAAAEVVNVHNCGLMEGHENTHAVECMLENFSDTPIGSIRYGVRITEPDRPTAWVENQTDPDRLIFPPASIPGGIMPGEAVTLPFYSGGLSDRADHDAIEIELIIHELYDADGELITEPR